MTNDSKPIRRRRRAKSAERRDNEICTAARRLFAAQGFDKTTMANVASVAGVAVGTIYLRYESKPALLAAVMEVAAEAFVTAMEEPSIHARPWHERFEPMFLALLREAERQPDMPLLMQLALHLPFDPGRALVRDAIERFMEQGQDAGALRPMPVQPAAALAYGMVQSAMMEMFVRAARAEDLANLLADAAARWMLGD